MSKGVHRGKKIPLMNAFAHRVYYIPSEGICQYTQMQKTFFVQGVDNYLPEVYNANVQRQWRLWDLSP